jgi:3-hydroxyacyl-[acyl-carrier-protein] dehydratase
VRFHLIDRVDGYEAGQRVRARKVTSSSEEFWDDSSGRPVMPPPLVLEALCQAGTWLIMITTERRKRAALLSIASVEFTGDVQPGDVVELEGEVASMTDEMAVISGRATVDGHTVMEATDIMCALIDASDLADLDDTARLQQTLTRVED